MGFLLLKLAATAWTVALIPVYWHHYGPANFLWFSDLALFLTVVSLWTKSPWPVSMAAVSVLLLEGAWNVDFLLRGVFGVRAIGLTDYMFESAYPFYLRAMSLFHVWLPPLMVWLLHRQGYERRAWIAQTVVTWIVLPMAYALGPPGSNINWVHGLGTTPQPWVPPILYLLLLMIAFPLIVYLPTHALLSRVFRRTNALQS